MNEGTDMDPAGAPMGREEEALERYRALFYSSPNPALVFDRSSCGILAANDAAALLYGWQRDEFVSRDFLQLFCEPDRESFAARLTHPTLQPEKSGPWRHVRRDGSALYVELTLQPFVMAARLAVIAGIFDVTQRVEMEQSVISSEQRYREIFENANDIIYTHDLEGNFTSFNQTAERVTGFRRTEIPHINIAGLVAPEFLELARSMIQRKLGGESPTTYELEIIAKDGRRIPLEVSTRVQFVGGRPVAVQGIARDVTERKQARQALENHTHELQLKNRELASALDAARAAAEAKSRFLANVSHETRTPMNGIIGMIHLLLDTPLTLEQREYGETVLQSARSLLAIMNDILDFSKIEAGRMTLEATPFTLTEVIQSVLKLFVRQASEKGLELRTSYEAGLPEMVNGDCLRLQQILMNLLANAIKFTNHGSVVLEAKVVEERDADLTLRFAVTDTGIGIRADALERIFESFVQADDSNTRVYGGTGLGLAISKQLVELMGGQIGVTSEVGKGSTFWFTAALGRVGRMESGEVSSGSELRRR